MRSIKVVLGLGFAVALMMAMSASSASALWDLCVNVGSGGLFSNSLCNSHQANGAWTWKLITARNLVLILNKGGAKLKLEDLEATGGATAIECTGHGEGTVGPGNEDLISSISAAACSFVSGKNGSCEASKPVTANAVHLPWKTLVELISGLPGVWDLIESDGSGTPGWTVECTVFGVFKVQDTCEANAKTEMKNTGIGTVESIFKGAESGKAKCSAGGAESGRVSGETLISAVGGNGLLLLTP